ncbi:HupE/UreJ family protein [Rhodoplanes roseus]|uniref:Ni/Fe hydrogenase n=1 Tax=Rhodoplanes roseus TaxID=29409 RepID=A0A327L0R6_9BRAD|nr:HupE/UreJ family protein [Rhodoplanes roseus]RAI43535.1 Ni/Fe hydrogenase [Rhodoplanes roseus]
MPPVPSKSLPLAALLAAIPLAPALAHTGSGVAIGLQSGLLHPITGADHLVAMVAVGLWGAQLGAPAIWVLPITFPLVMAVGGLIGLAGVPLPFVEPVVALSGLALGLLIALHVRPPLWAAAVLVGVFAIFHGYAHGRELPGAADPTAYAVGFVVATGLLHLTGILIGVLVAWPAGARLVRVCGAAIGCVGLYFLLASVGVLS